MPAVLRSIGSSWILEIKRIFGAAPASRRPWSVSRLGGRTRRPAWVSYWHCDAEFERPRRLPRARVFHGSVVLRAIGRGVARKGEVASAGVARSKERGGDRAPGRGALAAESTWFDHATHQTGTLAINAHRPVEAWPASGATLPCHSATLACPEGRAELRGGAPTLVGTAALKARTADAGSIAIAVSAGHRVLDHEDVRLPVHATDRGHRRESRSNEEHVPFWNPVLRVAGLVERAARADDRSSPSFLVCDDRIAVEVSIAEAPIQISRDS